jgi:exopolysaccharide biosynthesis polyprenyl glycosylphosphotransferase
MMLFDASATTLCFLAAYAFREASIGGSPALPLGAYLALLPVTIPLWLFMLTAFGAYRAPLESPMSRMAFSVAIAVTVALMHLVVFVFALKLQFVSRMVLFVFAILDIAVLVAMRGLLCWRHRRYPGLRRRILVAGTGERARRAVTALGGAGDRQCEIVGLVEMEGPLAAGVDGGGRHPRSVDDVVAVLDRTVIDEIVLAAPRSMIDAMESVVVAAEAEGVRVRVLADFFQAAPKRLSLDEFGTLPFLTLDWIAYDDWKVLTKRLIDLVVAIGALIAFGPLLAAIALAIKLDSTGPVFFVQTRIGHHKRPFSFMKFRTMCADAERLQAALEARNEAQGPVFKIARDPRVTRIGQFLRRTSLDELPQLWNVVRGDMSLVGPRPLPLRDVSRFDQAAQRKRFSVKPGITCLWQVSGRSNLSFAEWLRLDLWYIDNWSLTLDVKLLVRTVPAVLRGTGAT